jgi:hypothetical protein
LTVCDPQQQDILRAVAWEGTLHGLNDEADTHRGGVSLGSVWSFTRTALPCTAGHSAVVVRNALEVFLHVKPSCAPTLEDIAQ